MSILNDKEQRIFLSAMRREEKVCKRLDDFEDSGIKLVPICKSIERKVKEAIIKADYENRLKSDMVAMLTDIKSDIDELRLDRPLMSRYGHECYGFEDKTPTEIKQECVDIIQQKINALKSESEET